MNPIIAVALISAGAQAGAPTPASLVSKMFARYFEAKTLTGTIAMKQTLGTMAIECATAIQYERPGKLYLRQRMTGNDARSTLVTSDGKTFSYDTPDYLPGSENVKRLIEKMDTPFGKLDIGGVYSAAAKSLADQSMPLDVAIGRKEDLTFRKNQWASLVYAGKVAFGGESVHRIAGKYRAFSAANPSGDFEMLVSEAGDLRRYTLKSTFQAEGRPLSVQAVWEVKLVVDGTPDPKLFAVVK
ncbi:MAG: hypothetical protein KIS66_08770 [Fimbriimonadaceae bacterium]|nr:hypothetical protein [Fimbriimonadaceae bacterium]